MSGCIGSGAAGGKRAPSRGGCACANPLAFSSVQHAVRWKKVPKTLVELLACCQWKCGLHGRSCMRAHVGCTAAHAHSPAMLSKSLQQSPARCYQARGAPVTCRCEKSTRTCNVTIADAGNFATQRVDGRASRDACSSKQQQCSGEFCIRPASPCVLSCTPFHDPADRDPAMFALCAVWLPCVCGLGSFALCQVCEFLAWQMLCPVRNGVCVWVFCALGAKRSKTLAL